MKKGVKKRKKQIADASEAVTTEVDVDAETDEDSLEETDADESVTVDLGDVDVDEDDPEHIADAEKGKFSLRQVISIQPLALAIRRALEELKRTPAHG